jgi:integrase
MAYKPSLKGLYEQKSGIWKLDKEGRYGRIQRSTGTKDGKEAERRAIKWISEAEERVIFGGRTNITFNQAAAIYITREDKKSLSYDINDIKKIMPYFSSMLIKNITNDDLQPYIIDEQKKGRKASTINRSIRTLSNILNKCARLYRDEYKQSYLAYPPLLKQISENDKKITPSLTYREEASLLNCMNGEYKDLWLFAVNTGLRSASQTNLRWDWEFFAPRLAAPVFVIPSKHMKDTSGKSAKSDFYLILNSTSREIIKRWRGKHDKYVFPSPSSRSKDGRRGRMTNKAFINARKKAGLEHINWHSSRATFSTRMRALGVSSEDRATLCIMLTSQLQRNTATQE